MLKLERKHRFFRKEAKHQPCQVTLQFRFTRRKNLLSLIKVDEVSSIYRKWFALLMAEEKELSETEKAEILQSLFRTYVKQTKKLAEEIGINKKMLEETFKEEMKSNP